MNIAHRPNSKEALPDVLAHPRSYPAGYRIGLHVHREAQLLFAIHGVMEVSTPKGRWLVPPQRAVWVPARLEHSVAILSDIEMRAVFLREDWLADQDSVAQLDRDFVVEVGGLLRETVVALFDPACGPARSALLARILLQELVETESAATFMPLPADARARRAADLILDDPAGAPGLDELARLVGSSRRTLTRLFRVETGLSFKVWRQRARIMRAISLIGEARAPMKDVARRLGFSSTAAFVHAFRQVTGESPGSFAGMIHRSG